MSCLNALLVVFAGRLVPRLCWCRRCGEASETGIARVDELADGGLAVLAIDRAIGKARHAFGIDERIIKGAEQELAAPCQSVRRGAGKAFGKGFDEAAARFVEGVGDDGPCGRVAFGGKDGAHAGEFRSAAISLRGGDEGWHYIGAQDRHQPLVRIADSRSEENTSELQSLMRISYAVFCLKKKN